MNPVERSEIVDYMTYEETRDAFRDRVMAAKAIRRVHVGEYLTLLFENHLTVRYQIQEMVRAERIVKEADIVHELETYNELLGGEGQIGCTLLIEIPDSAGRPQKLKEWWDLPEKLYLELEDGARVRATFDERQRGDDQLSSVQYLKFDPKGRVPVAVGSDLPQLEVRVMLTGEQRKAIEEDLA
ncbi:MAG: DUF3501 domain-containing protein [Blastocatellia bacterium AA13]|nr:MAG: DUF3501 domain-containing protein [Blastocatellia bacterium AA13]